MLLTAAAAVLAGPSHLDQAAKHAAAAAGVRNRTLDWSAGSSAPAPKSSPDYNPSHVGSRALNGATDTAPHGSARALPNLVLPVQVSPDSDLGKFP